MLITPELKDRILKEFVETSCINLAVNIRDMAKDYNIDRDTMEVILDHFENLGFFEQTKMLGGIIRFRMLVPAFDFFAHGGFTAQEELLKKNLEKLILEIETLKPSMPAKAETLTSIISNITTALGLFVQ
ncbi:MAG: hypothetical protein LBQ74_03760 [Prevotella sp.]|jgi:hypothetical protein|nr:hypothetical protein [Prevotella sp.]